MAEDAKYITTKEATDDVVGSFCFFFFYFDEATVQPTEHRSEHEIYLLNNAVKLTQTSTQLQLYNS